ncbi:MAG TPA: UGSC family (seleno)protein, partial [Burkholderiales bacterium]|nr:UGSC family (seleno)protein [Burkholderiales bacterium]
RKSLDGIAGKVIGFIDNSKPNFNHLVEALSEVLVEKHGVARVIKHRKRSASQGAPDAVLNQLVEEADAIITGSGD